MSFLWYEVVERELEVSLAQLALAIARLCTLIVRDLAHLHHLRARWTRVSGLTSAASFVPLGGEVACVELPLPFCLAVVSHRTTHLH